MKNNKLEYVKVLPGNSYVAIKMENELLERMIVKNNMPNWMKKQFNEMHIVGYEGDIILYSL